MSQAVLHTLREEQQTGIKGGLYHQMQISLAYNSNRIEGSRLTEEQTRYIYETNTIDCAEGPAAVNDIIETANHFHAFDCILRRVEEPLTETFIKELHGIVKGGVAEARLAWYPIGQYKSRPNIVGNRETTAPGIVAAAMVKLLTRYENQPEDFAGILRFHMAFERIHPFQDGNGRVGRLLMFKECLHFGVMPFIIDERYKLYYYRGLTEYDSEPGFLTDTLLSAQDKYAALVRSFGIPE
ncbi:MAG: Fic family protein [Oscillospiraceae bacterium]|jgi:Fic family protein|nr:Fic family protein [Oscillospiraceae bacterium]